MSETLYLEFVELIYERCIVSSNRIPRIPSGSTANKDRSKEGGNVWKHREGREERTKKLFVKLV